MSKDIRTALLMDIYGNFLTDKQRDVMELYYYEDFSLSEIAEHENITRQGVHDSIKRAELILSDMEEKLGTAERMSKYKDIFGRINNLADEINRFGREHELTLIEKFSSEIIDCIKHAEELF